MSASIKFDFLLIDSCIAEYLLDRFIFRAMRNQLLNWGSDKLDLSISEVSYAELINGAYKDKTAKVKDLLETLSNLEVNRRILIGSAILANVYRTKYQLYSSPNLADRIVAATSFVYDLPIVTANIKDFPHPFFTSIQSENIKYQKKNSVNWLTVDVLRPNISLLNYWYSKTK